MKNIYLCGPTVYSEVHIGNMRPIVTFDIFRRSLEHLGEEINLIHNITDIDDKIIDKARTMDKTEKEVADLYEADYKDLLKMVNVITPNHMPKVTESMDAIIAFIEKLVNLGNAYESNGNVYFDVESIDTYGSVSKRDLKTMRYEGGAGKNHPADFALWKNTADGIKFDSPWGKGRPGWHTECSVFIDDILKGRTLDIHGGGIDLLFPHHENEDAQYVALNGKRITNEWRHVGHVNLDGEKMSKSLGNIFNAREFISQHGIDTLRMIFLTSSYSAPIDISEQSIEQAKDMVEKFRKTYYKSLALSLTVGKKDSVDLIAKEISGWHFAAAMKSVNANVKEFNKDSNTETANTIINTMELLGFDFTNRKLTEVEKDLLEEWENLRTQKKFEEADKIRKVLIEKDLA